MAELKDLFASVDANKDAREASDKIKYLNGTFDFGSDVTEQNGIYFIPEGDNRATDKTNYNFKKLANLSTPIYKSANVDVTIHDNEFVFCDTTDTIMQEDLTTITSVADNTLYRIIIEGTNCDYTSGTSAVLSDIQTGLIDSINEKSFAVTAVASSDDIKTYADVPGNEYSISTETNLSTTNTVSNKSGIITVTLDAVDNSRVFILDVKNNFNTMNVKLHSTDLIMGSTDDYNLTTNNGMYTAIKVNGDWRVY